MKIVEMISAALVALKAGEALSKQETWKKVQILAPYLVSIGAVINSLICDGCIAQPDMDTISLGLATLAASIFNHYLTVATTKKLGV